MWQRLRWLATLLEVALHRQHGRALLARIHASNLSAADRELVSHILRAMLQLPHDRGRDPATPSAPASVAETARRLRPGERSSA